MDTNHILQNLNPEQRKGVTTLGDVLIVAGAGSGKSHTLVEKIAYLISAKNVPANKILAISFTNKSADELQNRLQQKLGSASNGIWSSTFNALGVAILHRYHKLVGLPKDFTVANQRSQLMLVRSILKDQDVDPKKYSAEFVLSKISLAKNNGMTAQQYAKLHPNSVISNAYTAYQMLLMGYHEVDFDDMLLYPVLLFKKYSKILQYYQNKFQHIFVDEYQDTNPIQYTFLKMLNVHHHLTVVGDPDQSIFKFRGADYHIIMNFTKDYPDAHVIKLQRNYRSTKNILAVANSVIKHNQNRYPKHSWTKNPVGAKVHYYHAKNSWDEANYVLSTIQYLHEIKHVPYDDFGVLYRNHNQSEILQQEAMIDNLPYVTYGSNKFFQKPEIEGVLAYLHVICNPRDNMSLQQIINYPRRKISQTNINKLMKYAHNHQLSLLQAVEDYDQIRSLSYPAKVGLSKLTKLLKALHKDSLKVSLTTLTKSIMIDSHLSKNLHYLAQTTHFAKVQLRNLHELLVLTYNYDQGHSDEQPVDKLFGFLSDVALVSNQNTNHTTQPHFSMMTIHSAKGLEFPIVFIMGMEQVNFPGVDGDLSEERRLCYVAVTRAEKQLYITNAKHKQIYGKNKTCKPSQFIKEMNPEVISAIKPAKYHHVYNLDTK